MHFQQHPRPPVQLVETEWRWQCECVPFALALPFAIAVQLCRPSHRVNASGLIPDGGATVQRWLHQLRGVDRRSSRWRTSWACGFFFCFFHCCWFFFCRLQSVRFRYRSRGRYPELRQVFSLLQRHRRLRAQCPTKVEGLHFINNVSVRCFSKHISALSSGIIEICVQWLLWLALVSCSTFDFGIHTVQPCNIALFAA